jgi:hypothetical protein
MTFLSRPATFCMVPMQVHDGFCSCYGFLCLDLSLSFKTAITPSALVVAPIGLQSLSHPFKLSLLRTAQVGESSTLNHTPSRHTCAAFRHSPLCTSLSHLSKRQILCMNLCIVSLAAMRPSRRFPGHPSSTQSLRDMSPLVK